MVTENLPLRTISPAIQAHQAQGKGRSESANSKAMDAAVKLEATFIAEMLKAAGFGEQENSFSGGHGEDQFASFHRMAIAEKIAANQGIGLAEHFLRSMMETKK